MTTNLPALAKDFAPNPNVWRKNYHVNKTKYRCIGLLLCCSLFIHMPRRIQNPVKHLRLSFFCENSKQLKTVNYFFKKSSIADVWLGSKYASDMDVFSYFQTCVFSLHISGNSTCNNLSRNVQHKPLIFTILQNK